MRHRNMPIRIACALALCLAAALPVCLAAQEKSDAAHIRAMELKWTESYKQRQVEILASLLADDFVITVEDGNTLHQPQRRALGPCRSGGNVRP